MNFSKINVNKILSRYKALERKAQIKKLKKKIGAKWIIKEQHIDSLNIILKA